MLKVNNFYLSLLQTGEANLISPLAWTQDTDSKASHWLWFVFHLHNSPLFVLALFPLSVLAFLRLPPASASSSVFYLCL